MVPVVNALPVDKSEIGNDYLMLTRFLGFTIYCIVVLIHSGLPYKSMPSDAANRGRFEGLTLLPTGMLWYLAFKFSEWMTGWTRVLFCIVCCWIGRLFILVCYACLCSSRGGIIDRWSPIGIPVWLLELLNTVKAIEFKKPEEGIKTDEWVSEYWYGSSDTIWNERKVVVEEGISFGAKDPKGEVVSEPLLDKSTTEDGITYWCGRPTSGYILSDRAVLPGTWLVMGNYINAMYKGHGCSGAGQTYNGLYNAYTESTVHMAISDPLLLERNLGECEEGGKLVEDIQNTRLEPLVSGVNSYIASLATSFCSSKATCRIGILMAIISVLMLLSSPIVIYCSLYGIWQVNMRNLRGEDYSHTLPVDEGIILFAAGMCSWWTMGSYTYLTRGIRWLLVQAAGHRIMVGEKFLESKWYLIKKGVGWRTWVALVSLTVNHDSPVSRSNVESHWTLERLRSVVHQVFRLFSKILLWIYENIVSWFLFAVYDIAKVAVYVGNFEATMILEGYAMNWWATGSLVGTGLDLLSAQYLMHVRYATDSKQLKSAEQRAFVVLVGLLKGFALFIAMSALAIAIITLQQSTVYPLQKGLNKSLTMTAALAIKVVLMVTSVSPKPGEAGSPEWS